MENIQEKMIDWLTLDNEISILNSQLKELKSQKSELNSGIMEIIEENNLTNSTFKFDKYKLNYVSRKQTSPLTLQYVKQCLSDLIDDEDQINLIMKYILENRKTVIKHDIKSTELKDN